MKYKQLKIIIDRSQSFYFINYLMTFQIKLNAFNQNLSLQQLFLNMDKLIDGNLKTQIKQLINMQTLLEEYDRQNKYLNKQVLQLLQENKSLKIDKIKHNIVSQLTQINKYKHKTKGSKQNNSLQKSFWKDQRVSQKIPLSNKELKDEAIQVTSRLQESAKRQSKEISFQKQYSSDAFSFGSPTGRGSIREAVYQSKSRRQSPVMKRSNLVNSPQKIASTNHKQQMQFEILKSPIEQFQQNEKSKILEYRESMIFQNHENIRNFRRSSCILGGKRCERSSHAIEPSRKIEPSKSSKHLHEIEGQIQMKRASSHSFLRLQSLQKKKKRINLVSSKQKKIFFQVFSTQRNLGC